MGSVDEDVASNTTRSTRHLFGAGSPKAESVLLSHVIVLYTIIVVSSYSLVNGINDSDLWMALVRSSLGYLLPNPSVKRNGGWFFLSRSTQQRVYALATRQHVDSLRHHATATHRSVRRVGIRVGGNPVTTLLTQRQRERRGDSEHLQWGQLGGRYDEASWSRALMVTNSCRSWGSFRSRANTVKRCLDISITSSTCPCCARSLERSRSI